MRPGMFENLYQVWGGGWVCENLASEMWIVT